MIVSCQVTIAYSEICAACKIVWGPRAWVAMTLVRFLMALGIMVDYSK
jgi:hypothetical protein